MRGQGAAHADQGGENRKPAGGRKIPNYDRAAVIANYEFRPVCRKQEAGGRRCRFDDTRVELPVSPIPDADRTLATCRYDELSVWTEPQEPDRGRLTGQLTKQASVPDTPDDDLLVVTGRSDELAARSEGNSGHGA